MAEVKVQEGESIESALRRFKRKVQQEDIIKDIKKHSFYLKPGDEGVLSRPAAENENSHDLGGLPQRQGMHDGGDYFVDLEVDCA